MASAAVREAALQSQLDEQRSRAEAAETELAVAQKNLNVSLKALVGEPPAEPVSFDHEHCEEVAVEEDEETAASPRSPGPTAVDERLEEVE